MVRILSLLCLLFALAVSANSQNPVLRVEGVVHGYEHNPSQGLLKKNTPTLLQGALENAHIKLFRNGSQIQQISTNELGHFQFELDFDELYQLTLTKEGYNTNQLIIDTRAFPRRIKQGGFHFSAIEFVLNSFKAGQDTLLHKNLGRLYYHPGKEHFSHAPMVEAAGGSVFSPTPTSDTPTELLQQAINKNNERLKSYTPLPLSSKKKKRAAASARQPVLAAPLPERIPTVSAPEEKKTPAENQLTISPGFHFSPGLEEIEEEAIKQQEYAIRLEKEQLLVDKLRARTRYDSLEILRRERQIALAEQEMIHARLMLSTQDEKLSAQKNSLLLLISLFAISSCFSFLVFHFYRQKQKNNLLIESKNRQITDSLDYARRIQQSILISEPILQQHLPESFVFLQPKSIVSGDFYFVASIENKKLVAVADCTGHGVPGAFMSLIGHRLLREIVLEKKIHDPAMVLEQLHSGIIESLNQGKANDFLQDGMDLAVCLIDPDTYTLTFAGAMNPAYLVHDQDLQVLQADVSSVGGKALRPSTENEKRTFTNKACKFRAGCMLYLFTDGYMDQFGGEHDQKFNTRRFKKLLMEIQPLSAARQKSIIEETLAEWKEDTPQTDDILLMGIRLL